MHKMSIAFCSTGHGKYAFINIEFSVLDGVIRYKLNGSLGTYMTEGIWKLFVEGKRILPNSAPSEFKIPLSPQELRVFTMACKSGYGWKWGTWKNVLTQLEKHPKRKVLKDLEKQLEKALLKRMLLGGES